MLVGKHEVGVAIWKCFVQALPPNVVWKCDVLLYYRHRVVCMKLPKTS